MINQSLCHDAESTKKKKPLPGSENQDGSPSKRPKQKRPKIISPSRQKYETVFESYFISKYTEKKLKEQKDNEISSSSDEEKKSPSPTKTNNLNQSQIQAKPVKEEPFDLVTKTTGTINKKVIDRQRKSMERIQRKKEKKLSKRQRSLAELENEVERLLLKETLVLVNQEFVDRMRTHYNLVFEEEQ